MSLAERLLLPPEPIVVAGPGFARVPRHRARPRRYTSPVDTSARHGEQPLKPTSTGLRLPSR